MHNLDQLAAQTAQSIVAKNKNGSAKELDVLATKTLGVLQENGVYAAALFLESRSRKGEKEMADCIKKALFELSGNAEPDVKKVSSTADIANNLARDLDRLLLVKQLWEQALIYVRYGAKAKVQEEKAKGTQTSPEPKQDEA